MVQKVFVSHEIPIEPFDRVDGLKALSLQMLRRPCARCHFQQENQLPIHAAIMFLVFCLVKFAKTPARFAGPRSGLTPRCHPKLLLQCCGFGTCGQQELDVSPQKGAQPYSKLPLCWGFPPAGPSHFGSGNFW